MKQECPENLSELRSLLEQKKYEEALSIVTELSEKHPSHEEYSIMRYLVIRILVLQWNLLHPPTCSHDVSDDGCKQRLAQMVHRPGSFGTLRLAGAGRRKPIKTIALLSCATGTLIVAALTISGITRQTMPAPKRSSGDRTNAQTGRAANLQPQQLTGVSPEVYPSFQRARAGAENESSRGSIEPKPPLIDKPGAIRSSEDDSVQRASGEKPRTIRNAAKVTGQGRMSRKQQSSGVPEIEQPVHADESTSVRSKPQATESVGNPYRLSPIRLRKAPNFAADVVAEIEARTSLDVHEFSGPWAKVTVRSSGVSGYVRKEFLNRPEFPPGNDG